MNINSLIQKKYFKVSVGLLFLFTVVFFRFLKKRKVKNLQKL